MDGEGGWNVQDNRNGSSLSPEVEFDVLKSSETDRKSDAVTVQRAFVTSTKVEGEGAEDEKSTLELVLGSTELQLCRCLPLYKGAHLQGQKKEERRKKKKKKRKRKKVEVLGDLVKHVQ